ncbi:MAG: protein kinase, partial [Woeseiaceae bacterium]
MRVLQQGAQLADRYTLVRRLGSGGMSETWLARDRQTENSVALKFLASSLADKPGAAKLLRGEWQLGSRLMHANIVRVFEYHDDADGPFFSLQYLSGPDVSVLTGEEIGLVLRPIGLIADALRYAHGKNIVHRDIKAANVLLDDRGVPYLVDFGVAAHRDRDIAGGGSPIASSPQQLAGKPPRPEDDIYSLGVLIYELVSGHPPAEEVERLATKTGAAVPSAIRTLVSEMLAPDPDARPDAESVAQKLSDAGFAPGPVPVRYLGEAESVDIAAAEPTIRRVEHHARRRDEVVQQVEQQRGISPRLLGGGLIAAVLVFLAVVFLLPKFAGVRDAESPEPITAGPDRRPAQPDAESEVPFNENIREFTSRVERVRLKQDTEKALGELLSKLETLKSRAVGRWGGQAFTDAQAVYEAGDRAFLERNYKLAGENYREAITLIEPLLERVDEVFEEAMEAGLAALDAGDSIEAMRHYELAVAISPGHAEAHNGLSRAKNLDLVMSLTKQGVGLEKDLDLDAARLAFERALDLDAEWQPAVDGLQRVLVAINQLSFDQRMSEGLEALADGDFPTARAAFRTAQALQPDSREPADLVDQLRVDLEPVLVVL